jgi:two-component sensor histidine kinase
MSREGDIRTMSGNPGIIRSARRPHDRLTSRLALGAIPRSVPSARVHTHEVLATWNLAQMSDSAEIVVTELVTNAITHGSPSHRGTPIPAVHLQLTAGSGDLVVDVWDASRRLPVLHPDVRADEESGRGLLLIDALCDMWRSDTVPGWPGKRVRAVLKIPAKPLYP